ncbi:MAG: eukaryotic-like serine/threonine-protein kinase [Acidobacteriota bacterium]|jgi:serine/threonine protein kinase/Flp pilus assembly protein TadD|nr:eukaryotic-like serine/threonine-protein kinase [Acidobacteriota bacterium]
MDAGRWRKVRELFDGALGVAPEHAATFLERACADDPALRDEVEALLDAHREAGDFFDTPAVEDALKIVESEPDRLQAGALVGRYRIVREIGRGGMGLVLLAVRADDQFEKQVAVKILRRGMDSEEIVRRFRNERQILASLDHPYIAQLFDGGMTDDGLPYFVMEYIEGQPLDKYADEQRLSIKQRLELFRKVCEAVQYAHQNLVVHRDLKPSNILITTPGVPKLLDFGIAKVLSPDLSASEPTRTETRMMTPDYASPEQVRGEKLTTRSDVYSLGVVLYVLLTGHRPYRATETAPHELARVICEQEPTKPSAAINSVEVVGPGGDSASPTPITPESVSSARDTQPDRLRHLLSGDLDNIVLMSLRKERERRYESAEQLSSDIQRYLDGLPVIAHKDTFTYRASKFVRRNRISVAAACLVFLTLLGGIVATIWQARKAQEQARIANAKSAEAQAALARTEKINRFMQSIFSYANPDWFGRAGGRRDMSVLEAMRDIEKHIDEDFRDEPDLRADIYQQIGDSYRTQGLFDDAERSLREALRQRLELYGEDSAKVAESMYILSGVRHAQGDFAEQERLLTGALATQRRHPDEGNDLPYMMMDYASSLGEFKNDYAGALALDREALAEFRRRYGESHFMVGLTWSVLVRDYINLGDYAQAETIIPIVQEQFKQQPPVLWSILESYAFIKTIKGDYQAAENAIRELSVHAQSQDAKPYMTPAVHNAQSLLAYRHGDYAQAITHAKQALAAQPNLPGAPHASAINLAPSLNKLGQAKRAEALLREEIERLKQSERVFNLARLKSVLGESLTAQRRFTEAETILLEAYETEKARVLPEQYDLSETRQRLAELYRAWGKTDSARRYE